MCWDTPPPLLILPDEAAYRAHYVTNLCQGQTIQMQLGYRVKFFREKFDDAFFESANRQARDKSIFSNARAQRMDWIQWVLLNPNSILREGYSRDFKIPDPNRIVSAVEGTFGRYAVILDIMKSGNDVKFITAYPVEAMSWAKIRNGKSIEK